MDKKLWFFIRKQFSYADNFTSVFVFFLAKISLELELCKNFLDLLKTFSLFSSYMECAKYSKYPRILSLLHCYIFPAEISLVLAKYPKHPRGFYLCYTGNVLRLPGVRLAHSSTYTATGSSTGISSLRIFSQVGHNIFFVFCFLKSFDQIRIELVYIFVIYKHTTGFWNTPVVFYPRVWANNTSRFLGGLRLHPRN